MRIDTIDVAWNVYEQGAGKITLVFLHYFGGSGRAWLDVMTYLGERYRCIAPDLRGSGGSSDIVEGYTVAQAAKDVLGLISALELDNYIIVGHSMGGKIALQLAGQSPPGLRGLILAAPSPPTPEPMPEEARTQMLTAYGNPVAALQTIDKITAHPLRLELLAQAVEDNLETSPRAWAWWLKQGSREDITPQTAGVSVPILAIAGAKDSVIHPDLIERAIVRRYATPPVCIMPNVGHLLPLEAAEVLSNLICPFIQQSVQGA